MNGIDVIDFVESYGYIYMIKNMVNRKRYIGQTIDKRGHRFYFKLNTIKTHYNQYLYNSFVKYGKENFSVNVIDFAGNKEELDKKEEFYIHKYNTMDKNYGYNLKHGGGNGKHLEETKEKISLKLQQNYITYKKTHENIICYYCGKDFLPTSSIHKYCSDICCSLSCYDRKFRKKFDSKDCLECGQNFIPIKEDHKYCSGICRMRYNIKRRSFKNKLKEKELRKCIGCGDIFILTRKDKVYCSRKCKDKNLYRE